MIIIRYDEPKNSFQNIIDMQSKLRCCKNASRKITFSLQVGHLLYSYALRTYMYICICITIKLLWFFLYTNILYRSRYNDNVCVVHIKYIYFMSHHYKTVTVVAIYISIQFNLLFLSKFYKIHTIHIFDSMWWFCLSSYSDMFSTRTS